MTLLGSELEMELLWRRRRRGRRRRRRVESSTRMSQDRDGYIRLTLSRTDNRPQATGPIAPTPTPATAEAHCSVSVSAPSDTHPIDARPHRASRDRRQTNQAKPIPTLAKEKEARRLHAKDKSRLQNFILATCGCQCPSPSR